MNKNNTQTGFTKILTKKKSTKIFSFAALMICVAFVFIFAQSCEMTPTEDTEASSNQNSVNMSENSVNISSGGDILSVNSDKMENIVMEMEVTSSSVGEINIVPLSSSEKGVEIDSQFLITAKHTTSIAELANRLTVKNGDKYDLQESETDADDKSSYIMTFDSPLKYDSIYRIEYKEDGRKPLSFAFQTVDSFKILSTTPGADTYNVPHNSGIEVTFNEEIVGDFKDYFTITPSVNGKFDKAGNTYIFIPDSLSFDERYSVTIQKGVTGATTGKTLEEDYSFSFWTRWGQRTDTLNISGEKYETFLPDDEVFVEVDASGVFQSKTYTVEIYNLKTAENYLYAARLINDNDFVLPTDAEYIESLETDLYVVKSNDNAYYTYSYIMLNKKYQSGWYLIKISTEHEGKVYNLLKAVQVSPLAVYSASFDGEMVFWVNDVNTKLTAAGAEILIGEQSVKTDSEGKAILPTGSASRPNIKITHLNYPEFVYMTHTYRPEAPEAGKRYYSYVYTDRSAYRPTDTIDVFGVFKQRYSEYPVNQGDKITVKLGNMLEIPVTLDKYGSFNLKIPVKDMSGGVSVELWYNGTAINTSGYISFIDYDNSKYVITANTDKYVYRPNEQAEIEISVVTFDNTPVGGVEITNDRSAVALTDGEGKAAVTETISKGHSYSWRPYERSFYYNIGKTDNNIQYAYCPYVMMPSDIMFETKQISGSAIEFTSNMIDREAIEKNISESWFNVHSLSPELYRGVPADTAFSLEVHKHTTVREKTGERYDFIEKVNVPIYKYKYEDEIYSTYESKTVNGKAVISNLPESNDIYVYYTARLRYKDTAGNEVEIYINMENSGIAQVNKSSIIDYYFTVEASASPVRNSYYTQFKVGENGLVKLRDNAYNAGYDYNSGRAVNNHDITEGKILTILRHEKILDTQTGSPNGTVITFTEDCIYDSMIFGAYFDGKHIYPISHGVRIYYNYDERSLNFDVSFDKDEYTPGSEVTATLKVTDENGKPKKSLVNISVVDEAAFAENAHDARFINRFYSAIELGYMRYSYFASYTQHEFLTASPGAEMGGGGGVEMMRRDFRDNPAFETMETDENGTAEIKFKLADAITSWRVTVHGITEDNFAGSQKENIISSLPFNIDIVTLNEFVEGDDIFVTAKPFGRQYKYNSTEIKYTAEILSDGKVISSHTESGARYFNFSAGKLAEGDYTIRVTAETSNDFKDAMEKEFKVVKTGIVLPLTSEEVISAENPVLGKYDIKTSPVTVTFGNHDISIIMKTLYSCMKSSSKRTDYIAANIFARKYLDSLYNKTQFEMTADDYRGVYFGSYSGKGELTYGEPDVLYTARFTACFPETLINDEYIRDLKNYFQSWCHMYDKDEKGVESVSPEFTDNENAELMRAAGYFALAAAGKNILLEINGQVNIILNSEDQTKFTDSYESYMRVLFYSAALCAIGDDTGAYELFSKYIPADKLYDDASDDNTKAMCKEYVDTMMLYINTAINPVAAYDYIKTKSPNKYISDVCEKINFIRYFDFAKGTTSEIEYTLDSETKREVFSNFDILNLVISKEQFENLNLKHISGNTSVDINFNGSPENLDKSGNKIELEKHIMTKEQFCAFVGKSVDTESDADDSLIYIVFKAKIPDGESREYYTIRDRLPSNMRYIKRDINITGGSVVHSVGGETYYGDGTENYYVSHIEKQTVDIYFSGKSGDEIITAYNAIKINDSDAIAEKAYISVRFNINEIWGASQ